MPPIRLVLFGFGNVGRALARLLLEKRQVLAERYALSWEVVAIRTGSHGSAINPAGIDLQAALALYESGADLGKLSAAPAPEDPFDFLQASQGQLLFENSPVNYQTGQPALDYLRAGIKARMHVVTANKGPVVHAYQELTDLAAAHGVRFFFESTVMDGAPVFALWRETLPAADLRAFRGVLNSTTNLILSLMETGKSYAEALSHAQQIGIAETDPSGDTQGWDAAIKVSALVSVLMGIPLKPSEVERQGIEAISAEAVQKARQEGKRWKLICSAERDGAGVRASVLPQLVDGGDPLFSVMGTSSAVTFHSDVLGALTLGEEDPGPHTTAYGLLADFINACRIRG